MASAVYHVEVAGISIYLGLILWSTVFILTQLPQLTPENNFFWALIGHGDEPTRSPHAKVNVV